MSGHTTRAVTIIQKHFRGYLARKRYSKMLLTLFEEVTPVDSRTLHCQFSHVDSYYIIQEEEKRREKVRIQILEGEILFER